MQVNTSERIERYWREYLASLPPSVERPEGFYEAFHFGLTPEGGTETAELVRCGVKTSTGSILWVYEAEGKPLPGPGDLSIVTDSGAEPVCIIETTEVRVVPFEEVDARFAWEGGEGDRTLEGWRRGYWRYLKSECRRIGREPSPRTPMVCERFRVVYGRGDPGGMEVPLT